ncbi:predicted protein [Naegleria gruberi]|uniref:Predicted protein n=1 Tax=Naegleria gruberi TaxID=5762 RepID=D2VN09_NAEGR|nr:uncharacterized protein NAEGRDRAFT_70331 [Naegleria gruberi]EFC41837.1 predicted protein [Naegleria gruberi]|eukprot:XP_002674581.1 predicted protein [Naegleria gruberi strain NEG-M]
MMWNITRDDGDFLVYFPSRLVNHDCEILSRKLFLKSNNDEYRDEDEMILIHGYKQGTDNLIIFSKELVDKTRQVNETIHISQIIDLKLAHLDSSHSILRKILLKMWENSPHKRLYQSLDMIVKQEITYPNKKLTFQVMQLNRMQKKIVLDFPEVGLHSAQVNLQVRPFKISYVFSNQSLWISFKILIRELIIVAMMLIYIWFRTKLSWNGNSYSWFECTIRSIQALYVNSDFSFLSVIQMIFYAMVYLFIFIFGGKYERAISTISMGYFFIAQAHLGLLEESQSNIVQVVNASFELIHITHLAKLLVQNIQGGIVKRCRFWIKSVLDKFWHASE